MIHSNGNSPLNIAFADSLHDNWTAGAHYYKNLFFALRSLRPAQEVVVTLLRAPNQSASRYFEGNALIDHVLTTPSEPLRYPPTFWKRQRARAERKLGLYRPPPAKRPLLETYLREQHIAALFTCWLEYGKDWSFPLLTWIPDFQHLYLPELFTAHELKFRDALFERIAANATRVVLSSETARQDFEKYYPTASAKARVLPFVAQVPADAYDGDPQWVYEAYHLPKRYVYLPNQFWQHKNHSLVIQALKILHDKRPEIVVVCTGNTNDDRAPLFFGKLLAEIAQAGVRENLLLLGWVPYAHLFQLMRQAVAVLQPSRFEGWSTTVEETKSLGKPLLISDLAIHREQNPAHAVFFDPFDPQALAEGLMRVFDENTPGPDAQREQVARAQVPVRTREFGERFVEIATEVAQPLNHG